MKDRVRISLAVAIAGMVTVWACADQRSPVTPSTETLGDTPMSPTEVVSPVGSDVVRGVAGHARGAIAVRPAVRFVGDLHAKAMADFVANRRDWTAGAQSREARACVAAYRVMVKYAPEALAAAGVVTPSADLRAHARQVALTLPPCRGLSAQLMSVFGDASAGSVIWASAPAVTMLEDSLAYGESIPYLDALESQFESLAYPTRGDVVAVGNAVLSAAAGIHTGDLALIEGVVDLAVSSFDSYASEPWSGDPCSLDMGTFRCMELPQSVFMRGSKGKGWALALVDYIIGSRSVLGAILASGGVAGVAWAPTLGWGLASGIAGSVAAMVMME